MVGGASTTAAESGATHETAGVELLAKKVAAVGRDIKVEIDSKTAGSSQP